MCKVSGYNVDTDEAFFSYEPGDLKTYFDYVKEEGHPIDFIANGGILNERSCLSTLYESSTKPGYFCLVYFLPILLEDDKNAANKIVAPPIDFCTRYGYHNLVYCGKCFDRINSIKQCIKCPVQKYCTECTPRLSCMGCTDEKLCIKCINKIKKMRVYKNSLEFCSECKDSTFCKKCDKTRSQKECKNCSSYIKRTTVKTKLKGNEVCHDCVKCDDCEDDSMCEDCTAKFGVTTCPKCPIKTFCTECSVKNNLELCDSCPPQANIIERCIIISIVELTPASKKIVSINIPKLCASTGEWIENGYLVQIFLDRDFLINPLVYSMGIGYYPMPINETVQFFKTNTDMLETQMCQMDMHGPICKYLGLYPGRLVRIERKSIIPNSADNDTVTYRLIVGISKVKKSRSKLKKNKKPIINASGINEE